MCYRRHMKDFNFDVVPSELSDEDLFARCQQYGLNAKTWLRRFAGLLPEVAKRRLHRRRGFLSIHDFAAKLAGMSEYNVDRIFNIFRNIENKPVLRRLFESGSEGWSKIEKVAYVSTPETDKYWAEKLVQLSTGALTAYVQNYRLKSPAVGQGENKNTDSQLPIATADKLEEQVRFSCPVDKTIEFDLRLAKQNFEKKTHQNLTWNETLGMIIGEAKQASPQSCYKCAQKRGVINVCENCAKKISQ